MTIPIWLVVKLVSWLIHALIVMASVSVVSPGNRDNTLGRALLVTALVALVVTPFTYFWWLVIPGLIALFAWWIVYKFAYGIGFFRSLLAGLVQSLLGLLVDYLFRGPAAPPGPPSGAI